MDEHLFTCKKCGSHGLVVHYEYEVTRYFEETLPCGCGKGQDDIAATMTRHVTTAYEEWGPLDEDHHVEEWEEMEEVGEIEDELDEQEVYCPDCYEKARDLDWDVEELPNEMEVDNEEFYVRCKGCDREIEFGYSHPDKGGRIWPAECSDFNPWKSWPDPRYREAWSKKGWLRPTEARTAE